MATGAHHSMLDVALAQLDAVAERLKLDSGIHRRLRQAQRSLIVSVPTLMDNGRLEVFTGYRVQHDLTMGPTKGGIRYDPDHVGRLMHRLGLRRKPAPVPPEEPARAACKAPAGYQIQL